MSTVYAETPELAKMHLENTIYPPDLEFPFLERIVIKDSPNSNSPEHQYDRAVPDACIYISKHWFVDKDLAWMEQHIEEVCAAAKKYKVIRFPELKHSHHPNSDHKIHKELLKRCCLLGKERSWDNRDLLVYRPRTVRAHVREIEKQKYASNTDSSRWVSMELIKKAVKNGCDEIFKMYPEFKSLFRPTHQDTYIVTGIGQLEDLIKYFVNQRKSSLIDVLISREDWKTLETECDSMIKFEVPKILRVDLSAVQAIQKNKELAERFKKLCIFVRRRHGKTVKIKAEKPMQVA